MDLTPEHMHILLIAAACVRCRSKPVSNLDHLADRKQRLTHGCIFYMDGAGGGTKNSNYAAGVSSGMLDAGYKGAGDLIARETGKGLLKDQDSSVAYKRSKARLRAAKIQAYQGSHPGKPVGILGFFPGCAEAVFALEALPESPQVDHVVLLGASVSEDHDMTEAIKRGEEALHHHLHPRPHARHHDEVLKHPQIVNSTTLARASRDSRCPSVPLPRLASCMPKRSSPSLMRRISEWIKTRDTTLTM